MKNKLKLYLIVLMLMFFGLHSTAQNDNLSALATIGVATPILDNGIGFHIGINPTYALSAHFSIESQISYLYTNISGTFLSGNDGSSNSFNTLVGGRLYLNSEEKTNRFYLNLLLGGNYYTEEINNVKDDGEFNIGFSGGGFFELNRFVVGLSFDTPQNFVLKIGYNL